MFETTDTTDFADDWLQFPSVKSMALTVEILDDVYDENPIWTRKVSGMALVLQVAFNISSIGKVATAAAKPPNLAANICLKSPEKTVASKSQCQDPRKTPCQIG